MKSYKNLYTKLCSDENLRLAFKKARKGKSKKHCVIKFESGLRKNLFELKADLESMTYKPRKLERFAIHDPKTRIISASDFRDRVVHHALCNIIESIFEKSFICDSYANRKGKGAHAALKRFDCFKRKVSQNGKPVHDAKDKNMVVGYFLKADIKHYFDTVDHELLMNIIKKKIADESVLLLIKKILDNHESKNRHDALCASNDSGKGMPIGNLTSQLFANVYLNELDYFVKHKLKARYYIRYVDDFIILHRNRHILLEWKGKINEFLRTIKLELHPEKSEIYPLHHGASFLGFRIFCYHKLPYKRNVRRLNKKLKNLLELYENKRIPKEDITKSLDGWLAYARWGNTYTMRNKIAEELELQIKNIDK